MGTGGSGQVLKGPRGGGSGGQGQESRDGESREGVGKALGKEKDVSMVCRIGIQCSCYDHHTRW